jgi:hypothetical protein
MEFDLIDRMTLIVEIGFSVFYFDHEHVVETETLPKIYF